MEAPRSPPRPNHDRHVAGQQSSDLGNGATPAIPPCPGRWGVCDAYRPRPLQQHSEGEIRRQERPQGPPEDHRRRVRRERRPRVSFPLPRSLPNQIYR